MSILYVTDLHLSHNPPPARSTCPFWQVGLGKVQRLIDEHQPDAVVCGGDIFHSRAKARPNPGVQTILALRQLIDAGPQWYIVPGNHDLAFDTVEESWQSPLRLLSGRYGKVVWNSSLEEIVGGFHVLFVPYCGLALPQVDASFTAVFIHAAVTKEPNPFFESLSPQQVADLYPNAQMVITGHIHEPFQVSVTSSTGCQVEVVCPGSLVRRSRDELHTDVVRAVIIDDFDDAVAHTQNVPGVDDTISEVLDRARFAVDVKKIAEQGNVKFEPLTDKALASELRAVASDPKEDADAIAAAIQLFIEADKDYTHGIL